MNLSNNPVLRGDHYFHRLIDSELAGSTWSEGITAVPGKLGNELSSAAEGVKSNNTKIPDPLLVKLEEMTQKYREGVKSIEKGQSKLLKRLKGTRLFIKNVLFRVVDESNVLSDLGASFNAFSLELADALTNEEGGFNISTNQNEDVKCTNEDSSFRSQLEMIGQSSDSEVIHLHSLIRHHELLRDKLQEIILYCGSILRSLGNLKYKRNSLEEFHDQINGRKNVLMQMESNVRADDREGEPQQENLRKLRKNIEEVRGIVVVSFTFNFNLL